MKSLIILGSGGHGKVVAETALITNNFKKIAFLDDKYEQSDRSFNFNGIKIIGKFNLAKQLLDQNIFNSAIVAIGDSYLRLELLNELKQYGYNIPSIIHPSSYISPSCVIKNGTVVFAQVAIQSNVKIGMGNIINTSSSIDHDSVLSEGVHVCPGARIAGNVNIGSGSTIGIGSSIIQNISIGTNVTIGAGAVVIRDLGNNLIAKGVPAKVKLES